MSTYKTIPIDTEVLRDLTTKMAEAGLEIYDSQELQRVYRSTIIHAMHSASFGEVFPTPYIEDINSFVKQAISEGFDQVVISLITEQRGLAAFLYDIASDGRGVQISQAVDFHVPKKPSDRGVPVSFTGLPHLALDVSASS